MVWKKLAVNPQPITDAGPDGRNWLALNSSGIMLASHGLKVPHDTPDQPLRSWFGGGSSGPGTWSSPRWGWPNATSQGYPADVGQDMVVYDWTPGDIKGYVLDNFGALWPFGSDTPIAPVGVTGAPFGIFAFTTTQYFCNFQMMSGNGKPFGSGGYPNGFGWMIGFDGGALTPGGIAHWGGPITALSAPPTTVGLNTVRDFWVNPLNTGNFYVLYRSGFIHSGHSGGIGHNGIVSVQPSNDPAGADGGWQWMKVSPEEGWIIAMNANGDTWGYELEVGSVQKKPPPGLPNPQLWASPGFWVGRGDIVPVRNPARFYLLGSTATVVAVPILGTIQPLNPGFNAGAGTTPTTTTQPTLTWTFDERGVGGVITGSQKSYSVRVYPLAVTQAAGFVVGQNAGADHISDREQLVEAVGTGSDKITHNLINGGTYVAYVKVTDTAGQESAWTRLGGVSGTFLMNIPVPAIPTSVQRTAVQATWPNLGRVDVWAPGALGAGELRQFQVSVEGGAWIDVFGGEATASGETAGTAIQHLIAPTNVTLTYRARKFKRVPGKIAGPWQLSTNVILPAAINTVAGWRLIDPNSFAGPVPLIVDLNVVGDSYEFERTEPRGEFQPLTADYMLVSSAGIKGTIHSITIRVLNKAAYQALWGILSIERSLIFQTIHGQQYWVRCTPGTWKMMRAMPLASETTGIRHAHTVTLRMVETKPQMSV